MRTVPTGDGGRIKRYLGSGLVRGVGKVMAERIVDRFGLETLDVIDNEPERLQTVLGIGENGPALIEKAWDEQRHQRCHAFPAIAQRFHKPRCQNLQTIRR